jgi:hypothetical protein
MKRFTAQWMTAAAAAVLLTVPASGMAQTPPTSTPPAATQPPAASAQDHTAHQAAAQEHLRQASAALAEVKTATLPAKAKTHVAEIKRRLTSLERTTAAGDKGSATAQEKRSPKAKAADNWGTEVAAIDKALTALLGPEETTGAPAAATGTSGTTPAARNKAAAAITLDAEAKASLAQVRTHLTAFATAMAGGKTEAETTAPASTTEPTAPPAPPATTQPPTSQPPTTQPPTTQPPTTQPPATQPPTTQPPATPPADPTPAPPATQTAQADEEAARRHLTEARNTLSALTQLPAAAQLSGEARTQVAQLIANFNELITTQGQWRESYAKVSANLTTLIGPDPTATDPASPTGTPGAVGTSGTAAVTIDPAVREKLVELRRNLSAFEKAAGGGAAIPATPATPPTDPTTPPDPTKPPAAPPTATPATPPTDPTTGTAAANVELTRHVAAIEALLKMQDDSGGLTLTKTQVEELLTHWVALRQALDKK